MRKMIAVGGLLAVTIASAAFAQSHLTTPLLTVRFNQDRVYYQQPLYNAVSRALEAKPSAKFKIVSLIPKTGDEKLNKRLTVEAQQRTNMFAQDMVKMGIPQSRFAVQYQPNNQVADPELHLFVE